MGKYRVTIERQAKTDIEVHIKRGDKALLKRLFRILDELEEHPETGIGQPEQLKYHLNGYWSRRISTVHRLIYKIDNDHVEVLVISAFGHYE